MAAVISTCCSGEGGEDAADKMAEMFGPGQIDQMIRQGIQFCWMALPRDRKNADELVRQVRRIAERAPEDFREDQKQFGRTK